jgi:D-galactarolactone isomerase
VKLSGLYIDSKIGAPAYEDSGAVVRAFVSAAPERIIWGTGWPHTSEPLDRKPNDADLFDLLVQWIPDEKIRARILVDNAAHLFGFV